MHPGSSHLSIREPNQGRGVGYHQKTEQDTFRYFPCYIYMYASGMHNSSYNTTQINTQQS